MSGGRSLKPILFSKKFNSSPQIMGLRVSHEKQKDSTVADSNVVFIEKSDGLVDVFYTTQDQIRRDILQRTVFGLYGGELVEGEEVKDEDSVIWNNVPEQLYLKAESTIKKLNLKTCPKQLPLEKASLQAKSFYDALWKLLPIGTQFIIVRIIIPQPGEGLQKDSKFYSEDYIGNGEKSFLIKMDAYGYDFYESPSYYGYRLPMLDKKESSNGRSLGLTRSNSQPFLGVIEQEKKTKDVTEKELKENPEFWGRVQIPFNQKREKEKKQQPSSSSSLIVFSEPLQNRFADQISYLINHHQWDQLNYDHAEFLENVGMLFRKGIINKAGYNDATLGYHFYHDFSHDDKRYLKNPLPKTAHRPVRQFPIYINGKPAGPWNIRRNIRYITHGIDKKLQIEMKKLRGAAVYRTVDLTIPKTLLLIYAAVINGHLRGNKILEDTLREYIARTHREAKATGDPKKFADYESMLWRFNIKVNSTTIMLPENKLYYYDFLTNEIKKYWPNSISEDGVELESAQFLLALLRTQAQMPALVFSPNKEAILSFVLLTSQALEALTYTLNGQDTMMMSHTFGQFDWGTLIKWSLEGTRLCEQSHYIFPGRKRPHNWRSNQAITLFHDQHHAWVDSLLINKKIYNQMIKFLKYEKGYICQAAKNLGDKNVTTGVIIRLEMLRNPNKERYQLYSLLTMLSLMSDSHEPGPHDMRFRFFECTDSLDVHVMAIIILIKKMSNIFGRPLKDIIFNTDTNTFFGRGPNYFGPPHLQRFNQTFHKVGKLIEDSKGLPIKENQEIKFYLLVYHLNRLDPGHKHPIRAKLKDLCSIDLNRHFSWMDYQYKEGLYFSGNEERVERWDLAALARKIDQLISQPQLGEKEKIPALTPTVK